MSAEVSLISILVVDDQPGLRLTLKGILARKGYCVSVAEDGQQALERAQTECFDVVFMDIKMPGLNGVETFLKMKTICPKSRVILMTAFALEDDVSTALRHDVYAVLNKPFEISALFSVLDDCLGQQPLILLVDANTEERAVFCASLSQKDYKVTAVASADECLRRIRDRRYPVILVDAELSVEEVGDLYRQVSDLRPSANVIRIAAGAQKEETSQALHLRRPIDIQQALRLVEECLAGKSGKGKI